MQNKMHTTVSQVQECNVNSNKSHTFSSTDIYAWRMRLSVLWSIILQLILIFIFILCVRFDPFHPLVWLCDCLQVFLSPNVWLKLLLLVIIIYIQGEICKKNYVTGPIYHTTRFQKIQHIFCTRNLLLIIIHMVIGVTMFWIYSSISGQGYQSLTKECNIESSHYLEYCLVESKLFLLIGGLWLGFYYFANDYIFGSSLSFPLIQQYKFYRVKAALKQNITLSVKDSVMPTLIYILLYYFYGGFMRNKLIKLNIISSLMNSESIDSIHGLMIMQHIFFLWLFSSIFIAALRIMELLFNVHLTEHCIFPVTITMLPTGNYMTLVDSLNISNVPIIHHLGYLDLFTLSTKCQQRREEIFTLSHPGGHPHAWNGIVQECTNLIKTFTTDLNQALLLTSGIEKEVIKPAFKSEANSFHFHSHNVRRLVSPLSNNGASNIRLNEYQSGVEVAFINFQHWFNSKLEQIYQKSYVAYFVAESQDSRINYLLCKCQPVIWAVQSLSFLTAASLSEDRYGIVQRDLGEVIVTIVNLKQVLDKLFKQNVIAKKTFINDPLDVQMKYLLKTSVKRSLYKIAVMFGPYIRDLRLPVDIEMQMNNFIVFKEV